MKEIPLVAVPAILDSFGTTVTFVMNHGKQELDQFDLDEIYDILSGATYRVYPGTEIPYILEDYWSSIGKDAAKEKVKLFRTRVLPGGEIEITYKWWPVPLPNHFSKDAFDASLFPQYLTWEEFKNDMNSGKPHFDRLNDFFARTDAHEVFFYTKKAGVKPSANAEDALCLADEVIDIWTTYNGDVYKTRIAIVDS